MGLNRCPRTGKTMFDRKVDALAALTHATGTAVCWCGWCLAWHLTHQRQHVRDRRTHRRERTTPDD